MTLEQKVGQVFVLGFEGTQLNADNRALIRNLHLGGVTLFARNIEHARQLAKLNRDLQSIADPVPLFVSIDQEGGLVVRVTEGATIFPGNMALGATGDARLARTVAEASARELLAMGINMDLAPVVDVNTNPLNPVIGVRAFGSDAGLVSRFGAQTIGGLQGAGVSAVAKHFPGHGDTAIDSHHELPIVNHTLDRLQTVELEPFRAAIAADVDGIMTAHVHVPAMEARPDVPATLSRAVLTGVLREQLGYQGLILTDALDMDAIKRDRSAAEAAIEAFEAGADLLLIAGIGEDDRNRLGDGPPAMLAAVRSGRVSIERLEQSVLRVLETKARRGILPGAGQPAVRPAESVLNSAAHRELALDVARKAVTLQRDEGQLLPLHASARVLVVARTPGLREAVRRFAPAATDAANADVIVLATYDLAQHADDLQLARELQASGKPIVAVSVRGPYDAAAAPFIGTFLCVYGDRPLHLQAAAEALFGRLSPTGRVP